MVAAGQLRARASERPQSTAVVSPLWVLMAQGSRLKPLRVRRADTEGKERCTRQGRQGKASDRPGADGEGSAVPRTLLLWRGEGEGEGEEV